MNCASELDTRMDHDAEPEHVHGPEPACMIDHRHTPSPAQQGAPTGVAGGRVGHALALGQRRTRGPELDTELDHGADPARVHRLKPAFVIDHKGTPLHGGVPRHGGRTGQHGTTAVHGEIGEALLNRPEDGGNPTDPEPSLAVWHGLRDADDGTHLPLEADDGKLDKHHDRPKAGGAHNAPYGAGRQLTLKQPHSKANAPDTAEPARRKPQPWPDPDCGLTHVGPLPPQLSRNQFLRHGQGATTVRLTSEAHNRGMVLREERVERDEHIPRRETDRQTLRLIQNYSVGHRIKKRIQRGLRVAERRRAIQTIAIYTVTSAVTLILLNSLLYACYS